MCDRVRERERERERERGRDREGQGEKGRNEKHSNSDRVAGAWVTMPMQLDKIQFSGRCITGLQNLEDHAKELQIEGVVRRHVQTCIREVLGSLQGRQRGGGYEKTPDEKHTL